MHYEENQLLQILRLLTEEELIRLGRRAELAGDIASVEVIIQMLKNSHPDS